jgi:hypothetical protein
VGGAVSSPILLAYVLVANDAYIYVCMIKQVASNKSSLLLKIQS